MKKKIIIFGAGGIGIRVKEKCDEEGDIVIGFLDNDPEKWGSKIKGCRVFNPEKLINLNYDLVAVGLFKAVHSIKKQLIDLGVEEEKIIVPIEPKRIFFNHAIKHSVALVNTNTSKATELFWKKRVPVELEYDFICKLVETKEKLMEYNISVECACVVSGAVLQAYGVRKNKVFDDIDIILTSDYRELYGKGLIIVSEHVEIHRQNQYDIPDDEIIRNERNHFKLYGLKFMTLEVLFSNMGDDNVEKSLVQDLLHQEGENEC